MIFEILILKIIGQCEVKHDVTLPIKTITSILKVSLRYQSVSAFKTAFILHISHNKNQIFSMNILIYNFVVVFFGLSLGTYNQSIQIFSSTGQHVQTLAGQIGTIHSLVTSLSGRFIFSASGDKSIQVIP